MKCTLCISNIMNNKKFTATPYFLNGLHNVVVNLDRFGGNKTWQLAINLRLRLHLGFKLCLVSFIPSII
jgi:hypothetical protein